MSSVLKWVSILLISSSFGLPFYYTPVIGTQHSPATFVCEGFHMAAQESSGKESRRLLYAAANKGVEFCEKLGLLTPLTEARLVGKSILSKLSAQYSSFDQAALLETVSWTLLTVGTLLPMWESITCAGLTTFFLSVLINHRPCAFDALSFGVWFATAGALIGCINQANAKPPPDERDDVK